MALIVCPECGGQVSDKANSCPHCGFPIEKTLGVSTSIDNIDEFVEDYKKMCFDIEKKIKEITADGQKKMYGHDASYIIATMKDICFCHYVLLSKGVTTEKPTMLHANPVQHKRWFEDNKDSINEISEKDIEPFVIDEIEALINAKSTNVDPDKMEKIRKMRYRGTVKSTLKKWRRESGEIIQSNQVENQKPQTVIIKQEQARKGCPQCGSANIEPISTIRRLGSTAMFGLASSTIGKSMHCNACGYNW